MSDSPPSRFRVPHWGSFLLATIALVVSAIGLSVWLPNHREKQIAEKINSWGGTVATSTGGPEWLRNLVGEERMKECKVFERVSEVHLAGAAITDADVACLSRLQNLAWP